MIAAKIAKSRLMARMFFRCFSIETLNQANISRVPFTEAASLPERKAMSHVWLNKYSEPFLRRAYLREVENGNITRFKPEQLYEGMSWTLDLYYDLVSYWELIGEINFIEVAGKKSIRKDELRTVLKKRGVPWPLTWR